MLSYRAYNTLHYNTLIQHCHYPLLTMFITLVELIISSLFSKLLDIQFFFCNCCTKFLLLAVCRNSHVYNDQIPQIFEPKN